MTPLEEYYNKFNEDKRLDSRHGQVEFRTTMKYIHRYLEEMAQPREQIRILDVGAGTGRYSIPLAEEGYNVTAVELVKHNISRLRQKSEKVRTYQADARRMPRLQDESFDMTLLFGPMYHLMTEGEQVEALLEARRVTKPGGILMVAYVMNEFSVITYAFKERHILEALENGMLDETYHCTQKANPLYHMVRIEDIDALDQKAGLTRRQIIAADGAADYIRPVINALSEEEFEKFIAYHMTICERMDMIGASSHTVDILAKGEN